MELPRSNTPNATVRACLIAGVFFVGIALVAAQDRLSPRPLAPGQHFDPLAYSEGWLVSDRDEDGTVDYAVKIDDRGNKVQEAMDFNYDGRMDDFYFYENDVLQREELDSNFDGSIDIWVYLHRGVYIRLWERDTDFDGVIDRWKDYDQIPSAE